MFKVYVVLKMVSFFKDRDYFSCFDNVCELSPLHSSKPGKDGNLKYEILNAIFEYYRQKNY